METRILGFGQAVGFRASAVRRLPEFIANYLKESFWLRLGV